MNVEKAKRIPEKERDNCKYVEASVRINGTEFKACAQETYASTEHFYFINGMRLQGFSNKDNIESNMIGWANREVQKFISNQQQWLKQHEQS